MKEARLGRWNFSSTSFLIRRDKGRNERSPFRALKRVQAKACTQNLQYVEMKEARLGRWNNVIFILRKKFFNG